MFIVIPNSYHFLCLCFCLLGSLRGFERIVALVELVLLVVWLDIVGWPFGRPGELLAQCYIVLLHLVLVVVVLDLESCWM